MKNFRELVKICEGRKVYVQTHNFPDADAVGSAFGVKKLLEHYGIESTLCCSGQIDRKATAKMLDFFGVEMFTYDSIKEKLHEDDYIICVDSQKNGGNITDFIGDEIACIDHHPTVSDAEYKYQDVIITGACASIIAGYFKELGVTPDENTATALLFGLKMDTNNFTRGVTIFDIQMFEYLFPFTDSQKITNLENSTIQFADLRAYGNAIDNIKVFGCTGFACIDFHCPDGLIAAVSDFILALEEVEVAVVYSIRKDGWKFSVRSEKPDVHAGELIGYALAGLGNGGGHASMAGGYVSMEKMQTLGNYPAEAIQEKFLKVLGKDA